MKDFKHVNVSSVNEAVEILRDNKEGSRIIAGGTDLLGVLKDHILPNYPELLINVKTIPGLDRIEENGSGLQIGSLVKLTNLVKSSLVKEKYTSLAQAAHSIANPQIRNMGTVGGNLAQDTRCWYYRYPHSIGGQLLCPRKGEGPCLAVKGDNRYHAIFGGKGCFAVCPSDTATALLLLNGEVETVGVNGKRSIPLQNFFTPLGNVLELGEMITHINVPEPPKNTAQHFMKYTLRGAIDFAVVSAAVLAVVEEDYCTEARLVLGAVAPGPLRAVQAEGFLKGKELNNRNMKEASELAVKGAKPLSMNAYKIEIAKSLVAKSLAEMVNN